MSGVLLPIWKAESGHHFAISFPARAEQAVQYMHNSRELEVSGGYVSTNTECSPALRWSAASIPRPLEGRKWPFFEIL
jgi:hypothetical protein